jgi:hypothetical protein
MKGESPRIFLPALREVESQLTLPLPQKVRILSELAWDLEALWKGLVAQGMPEEEARERAMEALVPDPVSLRSLGEMHSPLYRQLTEGIRNDRLRVFERTALALVSVVVLLGQTVLLLQADLMAGPSPFLWAVLGLGALLLGVILASVFRLWVKGDHIHPGRGIQPILLLSGMVLLTGFGGTLVDLIQLAGILDGAPAQAQDLVPLWAVKECTLLSVTLLIAMAGGLSWFVLSQWLTLVRGDHQAILGLAPQT